MRLTLVLHNIRSVYNVGAILRTAEGLGVEKVVLSGYTPRYNNVKVLPHLREKLNRQIAKAALGAEELVAQENIDNLPEWLEEKKAQGWMIVGLENNLGADEKQKQMVLGENHGFKTDLVLILGEEVDGIPQDVRKFCDFFLEIPMRGKKESFNVSVAAAIAMWGIINS